MRVEHAVPHGSAVAFAGLNAAVGFGVRDNEFGETNAEIHIRTNDPHMLQ